MNLLIKGGSVLINNKFVSNIDMLIKDGKIMEIEKNIDLENVRIIDATGCYVVSGLIDLHCYIGEPGFEYRETVESASLCAARGGFTTITMNPNTLPVIDNKTVVEFVISKVKQDSIINILPYGSMTKKCEGKELAEIGEMRFSGIAAISDGDITILDNNIMSKIIKYAKMFDIPVITHCEDRTLSFDSGINESKTSSYLGIKGALRTAEEIMVARNIMLCDYYKAPIHISHVSTKNSVELIRFAKLRGIKVTAETSPHYFILDEEHAEGYNSLVKVNPPLRAKEDIEAVLQAIEDGTIDIISSDHKPNTIDSKQVEFERASFGILSLQTAFPLAYTYLVANKIITLEELIKKMSYNPAKLLGINKGVIKEGAIADITIFKVEEDTIDSSKFVSKAKFSPFDKYKVNCVVKHTIVNGKDVINS